MWISYLYLCIFPHGWWCWPGCTRPPAGWRTPSAPLRGRWGGTASPSAGTCWTWTSSGVISALCKQEMRKINADFSDWKILELKQTYCGYMSHMQPGSAADSRQRFSDWMGCVSVCGCVWLLYLSIGCWPGTQIQQVTSFPMATHKLVLNLPKSKKVKWWIHISHQRK